MSAREWTPEMGEISGFGGGYEDMCRRMLFAALDWLDEHPDANPQFHGYKGVYGVISEDNDDAKALSKAAVAPSLEDGSGGATGAMHQAVITSALWIRGNGWDAYVEAMSREDS